MDDRRKLIEDFARAIVYLLLAKANGSLDTRAEVTRVTELEQAIYSRMKKREPL